MIITDITCTYCSNDYSGLEALEHLDKEIELLTFRVEHGKPGIERQGYINVLTVLLCKRQILENNIEKEKDKKNAKQTHKKQSRKAKENRKR